ncbi:MAG: hypothetical protein U9R75_06825, partial [Candidatus Thermoplasmatota archaeon]|nr:hypothetical protein [Candidatus Thermoplasmatota archaeon]
AGIYGPLNSDISSKIDLLSLSIGEIDHFVEQIHDVVVLGSRDEAPELELLDLSFTVEQVSNEMLEMAREKRISISLENLGNSRQVPFNEHWTRRALCNIMMFVLVTCHPGSRLVISLKESEKMVSVILSLVDGFDHTVDMEMMIDSMSEEEGARNTLDWERLSLPISRSLMRAQGGDVRVIEEKGSVTGFSLELKDQGG